MTERDSPKAQLRVTLEAARDLLVASTLPYDVRLPMLRGLIDHALALSLRVGEVARPKPHKEQEAAMIRDILDGRSPFDKEKESE